MYFLHSFINLIVDANEKQNTNVLWFNRRTNEIKM